MAAPEEQRRRVAESAEIAAPAHRNRSYSGRSDRSRRDNFWFSDTESIRAVKCGDLLVEQDTDFYHVVARGSDGSRVLFEFHAHFTVNANGEMSADFDTTRMVCT